MTKGAAQGPAYGVVVPVRNEAAMLPLTVPRLLLATTGDRVRILWVCNGCTDGSAELIRDLAGPHAEVIELASAGKTRALQAGDDALGDLFPRLYIDADTWLRPGDAARLMAPLRAGSADLVAARLTADVEGCSALARKMGECWLALPHSRTSAFSAAIGLSAAGRGQWGHWPEISGDDIFASAMVPAERRVVVPDAIATMRLPGDFSGWVRMRARWMRGERQVSRLGLSFPRPRNQGRRLLAMMFFPGTATGAWAYLAARLLAGLMPERAEADWVPDRGRL